MRLPASRPAAVRGPSLTGLINTPSLTRPAGDPSVRSREDASPACIGDFEVTPREGGHAHDLPFPPVPIDPKRAAAETPVRDLNFDLKRLQKEHDDGSHGTRTARSYALAQAADTLHELGFKGLRATGLRRKHVVALAREWKRQGRSIGTMKNRMAHLRWLAKKIGKPGIVRRDNASYG